MAPLATEHNLIEIYMLGILRHAKKRCLLSIKHEILPFIVRGLSSCLQAIYYEVSDFALLEVSDLQLSYIFRWLDP